MKSPMFRPTIPSTRAEVQRTSLELIVVVYAGVLVVTDAFQVS